MTIKVINDDLLWDKFIDDSPYGMLFHKAGFLNCMHKNFGGDLFKFGVYDGDRLIAVIPVYFKNLYGMKMLFSPPPGALIPYLGFVVHGDYDLLKQDKKELWLNLIVDDITEKFNNYNPDYISFSTVPDFLDIRPFKWNKYLVDINFSYIIDLTKPLDELYEGLKKDLRKQIKKAEQYNLLLFEDTNTSTFFELQNNRYAEQNLSLSLKEAYVKELMRIYPENIKLYYLSRNEKIITGIITSEYKGRIDLLWGNPKVRENIFANEYLIWELIKSANNKNYKKFVIIGANIKRLCGFKSKFNPKLEFNFTLYKKDMLGKMAELLYINLIKKQR